MSDIEYTSEHFDLKEKVARILKTARKRGMEMTFLVYLKDERVIAANSDSKRYHKVLENNREIVVGVYNYTVDPKALEDDIREAIDNYNDFKDTARPTLESSKACYSNQIPTFIGSKDTQ